MASRGEKSIKVLAIDGGGIRGIIPAVILRELQKRIGKDLWQTFDLIAGTSTGGIIALGIGTQGNKGAPYSASELLDLYVQNGPAIFRKNFFTPVRQLILPKYSPDALEGTLRKFFQDTELQTALTPLLISSYDLQGQLPFFFKSHRIAADPSYNWKVTEVARATSAAPTFFPPLHLTKSNQDYALVDGGVMDSVSEAVDYELGCLPGCVYYRLQVPWEILERASSDMDNVTPENLAALQSVANDYVKSIAGLLDKICAQLKEGRGSDMPGVGRKQS